jgi:hypothetical protein
MHGKVKIMVKVAMYSRVELHHQPLGVAVQTMEHSELKELADQDIVRSAPPLTGMSANRKMQIQDALVENRF